MRILLVTPPFTGHLDQPVAPMLAAKRAGHPIRGPSLHLLAQGTAPRLSP